MDHRLYEAVGHPTSLHPHLLGIKCTSYTANVIVRNKTNKLSRDADINILTNVTITCVVQQLIPGSTLPNLPPLLDGMINAEASLYQTKTNMRITNKHTKDGHST